MKILSAYHCIGLALLCTANSLFGQTAPAAAQPEKGYKNPIGVTLGDPYVLHDTDGTYYMYGTGGRTGFPAYSSKCVSVNRTFFIIEPFKLEIFL